MRVARAHPLLGWLRLDGRTYPERWINRCANVTPSWTVTTLVRQKVLLIGFGLPSYRNLYVRSLIANRWKIVA